MLTDAFYRQTHLFFLIIGSSLIFQIALGIVAYYTDPDWCAVYSMFPKH